MYLHLYLLCCVAFSAIYLFAISQFVGQSTIAPINLQPPVTRGCNLARQPIFQFGRQPRKSQQIWSVALPITRWWVHQLQQQPCAALKAFRRLLHFVLVALTATTPTMTPPWPQRKSIKLTVNLHISARTLPSYNCQHQRQCRLSEVTTFVCLRSTVRVNVYMYSMYKYIHMCVCRCAF